MTAKDERSGSSNPFVRVHCAYLESQITTKRENMTNAVWNQSFSFVDLKLNRYELE
jgi:hypothetical protein